MEWRRVRRGREREEGEGCLSLSVGEERGKWNGMMPDEEHVALPCPALRAPSRESHQSEREEEGVGVVLVPPSPPFPVLLSLLPLWRAVTSAAPPSLPLALLAKSVQVHGFYSRAT